MNNAIRTRFDVMNKGEEPITNPDPPTVDLTVEGLQQDLETAEKWCGGKDGWDNFVERWHQ